MGDVMGNIEHYLTLTPKELQTLTAAMAGNFPESLSQYRMGLLRKLAKAQHTDTQGAVEAGQMLRDAITLVADWEDRDAAADAAVKAWDAYLATTRGR